MTVPARPPSVRFEALDAWRGICALLVALEHLNIESPLHHNALVHHGYRFVDFFFVLSGFVIAHAYRERLRSGGGVRSFLLRRLGRLWPLHVVMLLAFIAFDGAMLLATHFHFVAASATFSERNTLSSIPANLLLVQSWGFLDHSSWNVPSWSISAEVFAYSVFALICARVPARWLDPVFAAILVGAAATLGFAIPFGMKATYDYGLVHCLFGFMAGVLVRHLHGIRHLRVGTLGEIGAIVAALAAVMVLPYDQPALLVTPVFAFVVWVFASEDGAVSRWLRVRWMQQLGKWSYSIYMVHAWLVLALLAAAMIATKYGLPVFARVDHIATLVGPAAFCTPLCIAYLLLVVVTARFTYQQVELRGQRWMQRYLDRRPR